MARALVFYLLAIGVLVCTLAHFGSNRKGSEGIGSFRKLTEIFGSPRKPTSFAYCFVGKIGIAYPCHENPHWREDI